MMDAKETPLTDLLRIPLDARLCYENSPTSHSCIPVGLYCNRAADTIELLHGQLTKAQALVTELCLTAAHRRDEVEALREDAELYRALRRRADCAGTDDNREFDADVDAALTSAGRENSNESEVCVWAAGLTSCRGSYLYPVVGPCPNCGKPVQRGGNDVRQANQL